MHAAHQLPDLQPLTEMPGTTSSAWPAPAHLHLQADELEALPLNAADHLGDL